MNAAAIIAIANVTLALIDWLAQTRRLPTEVEQGRTVLRNLLADEARKRGKHGKQAGNQNK